MISNKHFKLSLTFSLAFDFGVSLFMFSAIKKGSSAQAEWKFLCCIVLNTRASFYWESNNGPNNEKITKNNYRNDIVLGRHKAPERASELCTRFIFHDALRRSHIKIKYKACRREDGKFLNYDCLLCLFERAGMCFVAVVKGRTETRSKHQKTPRCT